MVKYILDTCFIFHFLNQDEKQLIDFCENNQVFITSFNLEEIEFNLHKMSHFIKTRWRDFLKLEKFSILTIPVHPGNPNQEREYVSEFDEKLLEIISDPSDAVILVTAIKNKANILTRDKHHLFTVNLENYLDGYGIEVLNNLVK
ncbi:MAG: PIN domain-containing protein [Candidatus Woesearchaeota archaeon]